MWRDSASVEAQQDLDQLLNVGLEFATKQLDIAREFFPFGAAIARDGSLQLVSETPLENSRPTSESLLTALATELRKLSETVRATAMVAQVEVPERGTDAIEVRLEHISGVALICILPYRRAWRGSMKYGNVAASEGTSEIWSYPIS